MRTYDARVFVWPARVDDAPPIGDPVIDAAHDNDRTGLRFLRDVLGRDSIDGSGGDVLVSAHQRGIDGATWLESGGIAISDGDEHRYRPLGHALDGGVHEMIHGISQHEGALKYERESGAPEESFADVLAETAEQWHGDPAAFGSVAGARSGDWLIGEDVTRPEFGRAVRDMANSGTANDQDYEQPQPATMAGYQQYAPDFDHGGVHINSGIPNKAAHNAAMQLGSENVAKIWYETLTTRLQPSADFDAAALATVEAARDLYGPTVAAAVRDAWKAVGLPRDERARAGAT